MEGLINIISRIKNFAKYHFMLFANQVLLLFSLSQHSVDITLVVKALAIYMLLGTGGFLLNDFYDKKYDLKVGKPNSTKNLTNFHLWATLLTLWLTSSYLAFTISIEALILIELQCLVLLLYSHPISRLKEKGIWGVLADTFYAHILPFCFLVLITPPLKNYIIIGVLAVFNFLIGFKDILIHQTKDSKNDYRSRIITFTTKHPSASKKLIQQSQLVLKLIFIILLISFSITFHKPIILIVTAASLLVISISFFKAKNEGISLQTYIFFTSVILAFWLIEKNQPYLLILLAHPFLFSLLLKLKSKFSLYFNIGLYHIFLVLGRNLKEKPLYKKP
ncbi:MAG: hypothetical protein CMC96_09755 [Flavobacteriales bacterium]|nr:hypothetical protein [Flavobacteriales bacterium]|tara:strand:- start:44863 stop:45864 length:1002 start_codon:yes stop_codon:yes gene_type:complete